MQGLPRLPSIVSQGISLPSVSVAHSPVVSGTSLPTVQGVTVPSIFNLPDVSMIQLPNLLGTFIPTILADNERGNLNWNRPDPPDETYKRIGVIGDGSCFFHAAVKALSGIYQLSYQRVSQISEEVLQQFENSIQKFNLFNPLIFNPIRTVRQLGVQYVIINSMAYEQAMQTFRSIFVQSLREDFARQLQTNERLRNVVLIRLNGEIEVQAEVVRSQYSYLNEVEASQYGFQIVINDLIQELKSLDSVDARYALLLSDYYNVDMYVLTDRELQNSISPNAILSEYYNSAIQGPRNMRLPGDPYGQTPSRPSMVLIHVNGGHFEIVGKVNLPNNFITTSFNSADPFIRQLYGHLLTVRIASQII